MSARYRLGAEELIELGRARARGGSARLPYFMGRRMGVADPLVEARLNLGQSFADVLTAISKVVQLSVDQFAFSPETVKRNILVLIKNSPQMENYVLGLLVLASVVVKEGIRALGLTQEQVSNILVGAGEAVMEVIPEGALPERLRAAEEEIFRKMPETVRQNVRSMVEGSGISPSNLAPNLPESVLRPEGVSGGGSLTTVQKALLVGVPVVGFLAAGMMSK